MSNEMPKSIAGSSEACRILTISFNFDVENWKQVLTLAGKRTNKLSDLISQKMVERSKKREAKLRENYQNLKNLDAKLRFAFLASLRSAIFREL